MRAIRSTISSVALIIILASPSSGATFDFELPGFAVGDFYGTPAGDAPGDNVFSQDGIDVSVENFTQGSFTGFNVAGIADSASGSFFPAAVNATQSAIIGNIAFEFNFTGVLPPVTKVTFDYADLGGTENLDVNGLGRQELGDFASASSYINYTINVTQVPFAAGTTGTVEIIADPGFSIQSVLIGGQELGLDNLVAVPEPHSGIFLAIAGLVPGLRCRRKR